MREKSTLQDHLDDYGFETNPYGEEKQVSIQTSPIGLAHFFHHMGENWREYPVVPEFIMLPEQKECIFYWPGIEWISEEEHKAYVEDMERMRQYERLRQEYDLEKQKQDKKRKKKEQ